MKELIKTRLLLCDGPCQRVRQSSEQTPNQRRCRDDNQARENVFHVLCHEGNLIKTVMKHHCMCSHYTDTLTWKHTEVPQRGAQTHDQETKSHMLF